MQKITRKITKAKLKDDNHVSERQDVITGKTYKIKPGNIDHALYITINDLDGKPFEIFINTKCPKSISWMMTVTRMLSAIMRVEKDIRFIIDELKNIQDPEGGYFYKGMGHIPSVQAHIGHILEKHIETQN